MKRYGQEGHEGYKLDCNCTCTAYLYFYPICEEAEDSDFSVCYSVNYSNFSLWFRLKRAWELLRGYDAICEEVILPRDSLKKFCKDFLEE